MTEPLALGRYEDWKHCITARCGIPLTRAYVEERLAALADPGDYGTRRFVQVRGPAHLARVQAWFAQTRTEFTDPMTSQGICP